jgi:quinoprotein glucose dehydrogenase
MVDDNNMRLGGPFMPPAFNQYSVTPPGPAGGINFWGGSYDPALHLFVSNVNNMFQPMRIILRPDGSFVNSGPLAGLRRFGDADRKLYCGPTPWGQLVAVNMDTGDIVYRKTLGVSEMLPPGMQDTGRPSTGGVALTASGLTFVGGTDDFRFRAFATATGEKLWETRLPSSVTATPITYSGSDGRQYVAVVSTGGGLTGAAVTNDEIVAFALPKMASESSSAAASASSHNGGARAQTAGTQPSPPARAGVSQTSPGGGDSAAGGNGAQAQAADEYPALPPGAGRDLVIRTCSQCHSPESASAEALDEAGWKELVDEMAGKGANASDDEFAQIVKYLVGAFPRTR